MLAKITITLPVEGDDTESPQVLEALEALASVMLVQAEDGLWSLGSPDAQIDDLESEYLRGIGSGQSATVTVQGFPPAGILGDLDTAKRNVVWLLDHPQGQVDMHGLAYWAGRVESLRSKIRASL